MNPRGALEQKVKGLYEARNEGRADWADWLYKNHVFVVGNNAAMLAHRYGADEDLSYAAGILHDIADVTMKRNEPTHMEESLQMARDLMKECGFADEDITLVVDDAIRFHSCHGDERPASLEGQVLAAADSLAHLKTDFYMYMVWAISRRDEELQDIKKMILKKLERDFHVKLLFDDLKEETLHDYEILKELFSR